MGFALPTYNPIRTVVNFLRESQENSENSNIEYRPTKKNHSELNSSVDGEPGEEMNTFFKKTIFS